MTGSILALTFASSIVAADLANEQKREIDHLLNYVKISSCQFDRNGRIYDGIEAESHIREKYAFFRSKIESAEQFIEWSASKSTISGEFYRVKCADTEWMKTRDWLLRELRKYRHGGKASAAPIARSRIC
jgi:hypothetical protein